MIDYESWQGFNGNMWKREINVRAFIQNNYTPYNGDSQFLADPTEATKKLWDKLTVLQKKERENGGVLECETEVVSGFKLNQKILGKKEIIPILIKTTITKGR